MELALVPSRSGEPTCAALGVWLHSRYDPEREALRFAQERLGSSKPTHVVLLGPCLDYLSKALRSLLPRAFILSIQFAPGFARISAGKPDAAWDSDSSLPLSAFLDEALGEDAISGISVIEWEPAAKAFPAEAMRAREEVKASLDRLTSSTATVKASGKRWIENACASFVLIERAQRPLPSSSPVLVAAAGPSLPESLLSIAAFKDRLCAISVASALSSCLHEGFEPGLAVSTDGSYWSRLHLYPFAQRGFPKDCLLATPLTAAPSAALCRAAGVFVFNQGSFVEAELAPGLYDPSAKETPPSLPPHGTVSGSAIHLAASLCSGPIIVAGLDLASYGELDHARPHGFDSFLSAGSRRAEPLEGRLWSRSREASPLALPNAPWRTSRALEAYASALAMDARALGRPIYRLGPEPERIEGFERLEARELEGLLSKGAASGNASGAGPSFQARELPLRPLADREAYLSSRIRAWRNLAAEAASSLRDGQLVADALVSELLRSIDIVDYAAARRAILAGGDPGRAAADLASRCELFLGELSRRFS
jgi:hypothetical protein